MLKSTYKKCPSKWFVIIPQSFSTIETSQSINQWTSDFQFHCLAMVWLLFLRSGRVVSSQYCGHVGWAAREATLSYTHTHTRPWDERGSVMACQVVRERKEAGKMEGGLIEGWWEYREKEEGGVEGRGTVVGRTEEEEEEHVSRCFILIQGSVRGGRYLLIIPLHYLTPRRSERKKKERKTACCLCLCCVG